VQRALQRLPERQRSALLLSYYEGLSQKEVARVLGLGLRAVESLIVRARRALGKSLEEAHERTR
jgi:RNA polymerase sigma-70 factor (ECF subfamily)